MNALIGKDGQELNHMALNQNETNTIKLLVGYLEIVYRTTKEICNQKMSTAEITVSMMDSLRKGLKVNKNCPDWLKTRACCMEKDLRDISKELYTIFCFICTVLARPPNQRKWELAYILLERERRVHYRIGRIFQQKLPIKATSQTQPTDVLSCQASKG